ncbi:MAG TPA: substrate-binding domain-containing protein [Bacillales bacterium]|nr:substrate-binding domain-containing protein [Bacillales bacterium]
MVGGLNSIWDSPLFESVYSFRRAHPKVAIRLVTDHSDHISKSIRNGTIDVGFVYIPLRSSTIEVTPLKEETLQLVGSPALVDRLGKISPENLLHRPFIHYNWGPPFAEWFEQEIGGHGSAGFRVDHTGVAVRLLLRGGGIGFLLDSIAGEYIKEGRLKPVSLQTKQPIPKRMIYLVVANKNLKKTESFLNHMKTNIQQWPIQ